MVDALSAAACIVRAHRASAEFASSRGWPEPENDVYWHTREALCERRAEFGIRIGDYLAALPSAYLMGREELEKASDPIWMEVCHPEILARTIMES